MTSLTAPQNFRDDELLIEKHRPREAVLVIGVGGSGEQGLVEIARAMQARGLQFDQPSERSSSIVSALFIDGNLEEIDGQEDAPNGRLLREAGVRAIPLSINGFDGQMRATGLKERMTPNMRSDRDQAGCGGDRRNGVARYTLARKSIGVSESQNPRTVIKDIIEGWKDIGDGFRIGHIVRVIIFAGMHGGTGPALAPIAADAITLLEKKFKDSKQVECEMFLLSGESLELDTTRTERQNDTKRRYNSLVTQMLLGDGMIRGGVELPDGDFADGMAKYKYIIGGESCDWQVPRAGGHYMPLQIVAQAVAARLVGKGFEDTMSNGVSSIDCPQSDRDAPGRCLRTYSTMGAAEIRPKPSVSNLEAQKKFLYLEAASGIHTVNQTAINDSMPDLSVQGLLDSILSADTVEIPKMHQGVMSPETAYQRVPQVKDDFYAEVDEAIGETRKVAAVQAKKLMAGLMRLTQTLLREQGVGTAEAYTTTWEQKVRDLKEALEAEKTKLETLLSKCEGALNGSINDLIKLGALPKLFPAKRRAEITATIERIRSAANRYAARKVTLQAIKRSIQLLEAETGVINVAVKMGQAVKSVRDNVERIGGEISVPEKFYNSEMDVTVPVTVRYRDDVGALREAFGNWSYEEIETAIGEIHLKATEYDLLERIRADHHLLGALAERAQPLTRPMNILENKQRLTLRSVTVPVDATTLGSDVKLNQDGSFNQIGDLPIPRVEMCAVWPGTPDGGYLMQHQEHGIEIFEGTYQYDAFGEFLREPRSVRLEFFDTVQQHDQVMPYHSRRFAEVQQIVYGKDGDGNLKGYLYTDSEGLWHFVPHESEVPEDATEIEFRGKPYLRRPETVVARTSARTSAVVAAPAVAAAPAALAPAADDGEDLTATGESEAVAPAPAQEQAPSAEDAPTEELLASPPADDTPAKEGKPKRKR